MFDEKTTKNQYPIVLTAPYICMFICIPICGIPEIYHKYVKFKITFKIPIEVQSVPKTF